MPPHSNRQNMASNQTLSKFTKASESQISETSHMYTPKETSSHYLKAAIHLKI